MNRFKLTGMTCSMAVLGLAAGLGLMGCGSDAPERSGSASADRGQASSSTKATPGETNRAPLVESVTITPAEPSASDTVQARVAVSDPDGDHTTARYTWFVNGRRSGEGSGFDLSSASRGARIEVSVVADDGQDQSEPVTASVTLGNSAPRIESIRFEPSGPWHSGQDMAALPEAIDHDNDPLTFEYKWYVNGRLLNDAGPTIDGGDLSRGDRVQLVVMASDGYVDSAPLRTEEIEVANSAPEITSSPGAIGPDGAFRYQVEASDPDGDRSFMYRLRQAPSGMEVDVLAGQVSWRPTPAMEGQHTIEIEVDDRMGGVATQRFDLDVTFSGGSPPARPN